MKLSVFTYSSSGAAGSVNMTQFLNGSLVSDTQFLSGLPHWRAFTTVNGMMKENLFQHNLWYATPQLTLGALEQQREGSSIQWKSTRLEFYFKLEENTDTGGDTWSPAKVRIIFFTYKSADPVACVASSTAFHVLNMPDVPSIYEIPHQAQKQSIVLSEGWGKDIIARLSRRTSEKTNEIRIFREINFSMPYDPTRRKARKKVFILRPPQKKVQYTRNPADDSVGDWEEFYPMTNHVFVGIFHEVPHKLNGATNPNALLRVAFKHQHNYDE